jgi:hypothetical protein
MWNYSQIPSWEEAQNKTKCGNYNALDEFVFSYEPAGEIDTKEFRSRLLNLINYIEHQVKFTMDRSNYYA